MRICLGLVPHLRRVPLSVNHFRCREASNRNSCALRQTPIVVMLGGPSVLLGGMRGRNCSTINSTSLLVSVLFIRCRLGRRRLPHGLGNNSLWRLLVKLPAFARAGPPTLVLGLVLIVIAPVPVEYSAEHTPFALRRILLMTVPSVDGRSFGLSVRGRDCLRLDVPVLYPRRMRSWNRGDILWVTFLLDAVFPRVSKQPMMLLRLILLPRRCRVLNRVSVMRRLLRLGGPVLRISGRVYVAGSDVLSTTSVLVVMLGRKFISSNSSSSQSTGSQALLGPGVRLVIMVTVAVRCSKWESPLRARRAGLSEV